MKINYVSFIFMLFIFISSSEMKINHFRRLRGTDDCKVIKYLPNEQNVKIIGRFYQEKDITWIVHSGSAIEFYVKGNSVNILLVGDSSIYADADLRPRFGVYLDDELLLDSTMNELELNVNLFKDEINRKAKVKIMLLSENKYGGIGIKNINVYTCSNKKAVEPAEKKNLSIEFIGDSLTCAYGVEGKNQNEHFKTTTENFSKSYAYLASQLLGADYSSVCYSGYGVVSGYSKGEKNEKEVLPLYYRKIGKYENYPGEWNFEKYKNDIIFMNLGANDSYYILKNPEKRNDEFIQEYINFIMEVRKYNPESIIICTVGNIGENQMYKLIEKAVNLIDDKKVISFELPKQNPKDGYGSNWHPSVASQERFSKIVAEKIKEIYKEYIS